MAGMSPIMYTGRKRVGWGNNVLGNEKRRV
jgi:hypothetical protein